MLIKRSAGKRNSFDRSFFIIPITYKTSRMEVISHKLHFITNLNKAEFH
jgi:hypothetical protein